MAEFNEQAFQEWYKVRAKRFGIDSNPDNPLHFYDYRAAYKAGAEPDRTGHWPSKFKLEGHPRMIINGINTKTGEKVRQNGIDPDLQAMLVKDFGYEPNKIKRIANRALSPLGKIFDVLDTGLNVVASTYANQDPNLREFVKAAPKKLGVPNITFSDIIEHTGKKRDIYSNAVLGFALDVLGDPLTYLSGVGLLTESGKITKIVEGAAKAGESISAFSEVGQKAAKLVGMAPSARAIKVAKKTLVLGESLAEQAKKHQRALVSIGIPFTGVDVPIVYGSKIMSTMEDISKYIKTNNPGKAFYKLFATSSGNPKFDVVRDDMLSLGRHLSGQAKMDSKTFARMFDKIAKETGEKPEVLKQSLRDLVELPDYGNYSAMSVIKENGPAIKRRLYDNAENFEKVFKTLKGMTALNQKEKAKLYRTMLDEITNIHTFGNPYTLGFRQLPDEFRGLWAKEIAKQSGMYTLKDVGKRFNKYVEYDKVLSAFNRGIKYKGKMLSSDDSALMAFVGPGEYNRIKKIEVFMMNKKGEPLKKEYQKAATEIGALRSSIRHNLEHVEEAFTLSHMMYQSHPEYLKKINPKVFELMDNVISQSPWKVDALVNQFHLPKRLAVKYPKLYDMAQQSRREYRIIHQEEVFSGVPAHENVGDIHYLPHIPVQEIRNFLQEHLPKSFQGAGKEWTLNHVSQLKRRFSYVDGARVSEAYNAGLITRIQRDALVGKNPKKYLRSLVDNKKISEEFAVKLTHFMTISEVEKVTQAGRLKLLNGRKFPKFFDDNPVEQLRIRGQRAARAISSAKFFEAARAYGKPVANNRIAPEGLQFVLSAPLNGVDEYGQRLAFAPEIAKHIDAFRESLNLPKATHPFIEKYDILNDLWKAWTLAIFPATHIRDTIGNIFNNFLAGMGISSVPYYIKALKIQTRGTFKASERIQALVKEGKFVIPADSNIVLKTGKKLTGDQLFQEAREHGILDMAWFYGDVEKYYEAEAKSSLQKLAKGHGLVDAGLGVKKYMQNNANLSHYIWQREKGMSAIDAAASVKKYQFDFQQLTATERNVFRRIIPFYTWTRKNVPLQLEALATTPNRPVGVNKFIGSAVETNYDGVPDERYLPDWFLENYPVRVRKNQTTNNFEYFLLGSWLPMADIDKIFHPVRFALNSMSPLLKEPLQQVTNKDFYFGREIDQGDEYERFLGKNMNKRVSHMLRQLRVLNEADKYAFTPEGAQISESTRNIRLLFGKLYPYDPELQREFKAKDYKARESNLKSLMRKAVNKGDELEQDRIQRRIEQLVEEAANKLN